MHLSSQIALILAGTGIALGGLYDLYTPRLPLNLASKCSGNEPASIVVRELLRALGACLVAIGAVVVILAVRGRDPDSLLLILILVLPSETVNAVGMYRAGSRYVIPLVFILLTLLGSALAVLA